MINKILESLENDEFDSFCHSYDSCKDSLTPIQILGFAVFLISSSIDEALVTEWLSSELRKFHFGESYKQLFFDFDIDQSLNKFNDSHYLNLLLGISLTPLNSNLGNGLSYFLYKQTRKECVNWVLSQKFEIEMIAILQNIAMVDDYDITKKILSFDPVKTKEYEANLFRIAIIQNSMNMITALTDFGLSPAPKQSDLGVFEMFDESMDIDSRLTGLDLLITLPVEYLANKINKKEDALILANLRHVTPYTLLSMASTDKAKASILKIIT